MKPVTLNRPLTVIGLMSGTSVDGIDATLVQTDGVTLQRTDHAGLYPYREQTRQGIWQAVKEGSALQRSSGQTRLLERLIAEDHAAAVKTLIAQANVSVDIIGFHGQTVWHDPEAGQSIQLGDASRLAALSQIDTVYAFRQADMLAGGQGAPLAPVYHRALIEEQQFVPPVHLVNIGGVSNLTSWDGCKLYGFDCGPGNCLMDDYLRQHSELSYDKDGALARMGKVDAVLVQEVMDHPFFRLPPPRSLDRQLFAYVLEHERLQAVGLNDALATLATITVQPIVNAIVSQRAVAGQVLVAGGGQHNRTIMNGLQDAMNIPVMSANDAGLPGDMIEAELMAYLAARYVYALPATWPTTTGVSEPTVAGQLSVASKQAQVNA